jgi:hypothetical protein
LIILLVFASVISGCSLISHAKQQSTTPKTAITTQQGNKTETTGKTKLADKTQSASKTEQTSQSDKNQAQADKGNKDQNKSGTEADKQDENKNAAQTGNGNGMTAIGDSVMVEIGPSLQKLYPGIVVDGKVGRQMYQAPQVIKDLDAQGKLGQTVIIELGANGPFTEKQFADILELLGADRQIILVNTRVPRQWEAVVNLLLGQAAENNTNIKLVDWYGASSGHNEYFYNDGVHLKTAGVDAYAALVAGVLTPPAADGKEKPDQE